MIASHVLEDVRDPLFVCSELVRVGKRGYIETPSREVESCRNVQSQFYTGYMHHRWFVEMDPAGNTVIFTPKTPVLIAYPILQVQRPSKEYASLVWEDSFFYRENYLFSEEQIMKDLLRFRGGLALDKKDRGVLEESVRQTYQGHRVPKKLLRRIRHRMGRILFETYTRFYR